MRSCAAPAALIDRSGTAAAAEISIGRIGDALIVCEAKRAALAETLGRLGEVAR